MTPHGNEAPVSLEKLDGHLKALLRLKIREFVHLSPWFKDTPVVSSAFSSSETAVSRGSRSPFFMEPEACPHRKHDGKHGRRYVRSAVHAARI